MSSDNSQSFSQKDRNGMLYEKVQELGNERIEELQDSLTFIQKLRSDWLLAQNADKENTVAPNDQLDRSMDNVFK